MLYIYVCVYNILNYNTYSIYLWIKFYNDTVLISLRRFFGLKNHEKGHYYYFGKAPTLLLQAYWLTFLCSDGSSTWRTATGSACHRWPPFRSRKCRPPGAWRCHPAAAIPGSGWVAGSAGFSDGLSDWQLTHGWARDRAARGSRARKLRD